MAGWVWSRAEAVAVALSNTPYISVQSHLLREARRRHLFTSIIGRFPQPNPCFPCTTDIDFDLRTKKAKSSSFHSRQTSDQGSLPLFAWRPRIKSTDFILPLISQIN